MALEAQLESTEHGLRPKRDGWFVFNGVHCPPGINHAIVAAESSPRLLLAVGARERSVGPGWGAYTVDEAALRHNAGVAEETSDAKKAYAALGPREPVSYREGWLPG
jgi:hypothetical protein